MKANGHPDAEEYGIGVLGDLSDLQSHIVNRQIRMLGQMIHQIGGSVMGSKEQNAALQKTMKLLSD